MDSSFSAGVRKPAIRRLPEWQWEEDDVKFLTRTQRTEVQRIVRSNIELKYFGFNTGIGTAISNTFNISLPHSWYHKEPPILPELVTSLIGSQWSSDLKSLIL